MCLYVFWISCNIEVFLSELSAISAPKRASRIIWNPELEDDSLNPHSPRRTPIKTRSALRQVNSSSYSVTFVDLYLILLLKSKLIGL